MKIPFKWLSRSIFYVTAGLLFMIAVIWIARTRVFYLCYVPLIVAAILLSGVFISEKIIKLPSNGIRCIGFIAGMTLSELLFGITLIAGGELNFQSNSIPKEWLILAIELLLGIAVFLLFYAISLFAKIIVRKLSINGQE